MDKKRNILGNKIYLYLTEFFAGMSVMAVELGASRLLIHRDTFYHFISPLLQIIQIPDQCIRVAGYIDHLPGRKLHHRKITTIVINVNDRDTSMVLGEKEQVIYGRGYIEDNRSSPRTETMISSALLSSIRQLSTGTIRWLFSSYMPEIILCFFDRDTSMVLGEKEQVIYGRGYIEDKLCGRTFRISPKSFYQVNAVPPSPCSAICARNLPASF